MVNGGGDDADGDPDELATVMVLMTMLVMTTITSITVSPITDNG